MTELSSPPSHARLAAATSVGTALEYSDFTAYAIAAGLVFNTEPRCGPRRARGELLVDRGRVSGAVVSDVTGRSTIRARDGVVLATGGYDRNAELQHALVQLSGVQTMSPPTLRGDHLAIGREGRGLRRAGHGAGRRCR